MLSVAPLTHQARGELKGRHLRLAKGVGVELALSASEVTEGNLKHATESTHTETDMLVGSRPDNIVVGEVEGRALVKGLTAGSETTALRHGEIQHNLNVTSPVPGVGKDKDSINDNISEVTLTGVGVLLIRQLPERGGSGVVLDDIARSDNVLEAVALGYLAALFTLATDDEDGAVGVGHLAHRRVAADELAGLNVALELAGEVAAALFFSLAATVGEEDVRAKNMSA